MTKKEVKQAWEEFLANKGKICKVVVHCDTEKKTNRLLKYLHKKGFKWGSGHDLTIKNEYRFFENDTCYTCIVGVKSKETIERFFKEHIILEFDDIEKYLKKKKKVTLKKYSKTYKEFNENICKKPIVVLVNYHTETMKKMLYVKNYLLNILVRLTKK